MTRLSHSGSGLRLTDAVGRRENGDDDRARPRLSLLAQVRPPASEALGGGAGHTVVLWMFE